MKKQLLYLFLFFAATLNAQYNPQVFTDLYGGNDPVRGVNNLFFSAQLNNQLFFNLRDDNDEYKLYVTDGQVANTLLLKTVPQVLNLVAFDNFMFFSFVDPVNGVELWKTDGTVNGTTLVSTLGGNFTAASSFVVASNRLFFASGNTASPTLKQIYSLDAGSNNPILLDAKLFDITGMTAYNGNVVFSASASETNSFLRREPYITDGTQAGTSMIKDIKSGVEGSTPNGYLLFQNKLFFSADDGIAGTELWFTDGTESGTQILKNINPGSGNAFFNFNSGIFNGKLFFGADDGSSGSEVWTTDGTANGTTLFKDINPAGNSGPSGFIAVNSKLIFVADNGTNGYEPWVSDGTALNTTILKDINPGAGSASYGLYKSNKLCDNQFFFDADNGGNNIEPWVTDGTVTGTQLVDDINPSGSSVDFETRYIAFDDRIFFAAGTGTGRELFEMDPNCTLLEIVTSASESFKIYPNPTKNILFIDGETAISKIEVHNTLGQLVLKINGNKNSIDLGTFNRGMYFVSVTDQENNITTQKVIVE